MPLSAQPLFTFPRYFPKTWKIFRELAGQSLKKSSIDRANCFKNSVIDKEKTNENASTGPRVYNESIVLAARSDRSPRYFLLRSLSRKKEERREFNLEVAGRCKFFDLDPPELHQEGQRRPGEQPQQVPRPQEPQERLDRLDAEEFVFSAVVNRVASVRTPKQDRTNFLFVRPARKLAGLR